MSSHRLQLLGWLLFALSGLFFLTDAVETGDKTALGAAITWLVGVVAFLMAGRRDSDE